MIFNYFLAFDLLTLTYGRDNFLGGDENQFWQSTQRVPPISDTRIGSGGTR